MTDDTHVRPSGTEIHCGHNGSPNTILPTPALSTSSASTTFDDIFHWAWKGAEAREWERAVTREKANVRPSGTEKIHGHSGSPNTFLSTPAPPLYICIPQAVLRPITDEIGMNVRKHGNVKEHGNIQVDCPIRSHLHPPHLHLPSRMMKCPAGPPALNPRRGCW